MGSGSDPATTPVAVLFQEEWAVHFSEMLAINSSLVELHLGKMGLTDSGMESLAEGLKKNHSLRYLDLRWYKVPVRLSLYCHSKRPEPLGGFGLHQQFSRPSEGGGEADVQRKPQSPS